MAWKGKSWSDNNRRSNYSKGQSFGRRTREGTGKIGEAGKHVRYEYVEAMKEVNEAAAKTVQDTMRSTWCGWLGIGSKTSSSKDKDRVDKKGEEDNDDNRKTFRSRLKWLLLCKETEDT